MNGTTTNLGEVLASKLKCEFDETKAPPIITAAAPKTILEEAAEIISGPRRDSYGDAVKSFERIAAGWSQIFGCSVTARQVCQAMIWLKVCRDANKPSRDSLVDICGYAALADKL